MKRILRPRSVFVLTILVALGTAAGVFAWWHANGAGSASASLATLGSPAPVSARSDSGVAHVSWTKVASPSGNNSDVTYLVERSVNGTSWGAVGSGTGDTCNGSLPQGTSTCDDHPATTGDYSYRVTARFNASWTSSAVSASVHVITDTTAPTTTDNAPSGWSNSDVTVKLTATDSGTLGGDPSGIASITYSIDAGNATTVTVSGAPASSSTNVLISAPSNHSNDGTHTISYYATDVAGNAETSHNATVAIDTQKPSTVATGADSNWHNSAVTVHLAASDQAGLSGVLSVKYAVDSGSQQTISGASGDVVVSAPSDHSNDGIHTVSYFATDNAGNVESAGSVTVKIDTQKPTTTDNASSAWTNAASATVTLTPSDTGGSGVAHTYYTTDGSDPTSSGTRTDGTRVVVSAAGQTTIKYASVDAAGNVESPVKSATVKIDRTSPTTTDNAPAAARNTGVTVTLSASDPGASATPATGSGIASITYSVDGGSATTAGISGSPATATTTVTINAPFDHSNDGSHTISYFATDSAGNAETSHNATVKIDTTAPTAAISFPANGSTYKASTYNSGCATPGICGTASDATGVESVKVSIRRGSGNYWNGTSFGSTSEVFQSASGTTNWNYPLVLPADGSYTVHVQTTDTVGNALTGTNYAATSTFTIDTTAPAVAITSVNGAPRTFPYSTNANITSVGGTCGTATGDTASVSVTINGSPAAPSSANCVSGSWTLTLTTALSAATTYSFVATQTDSSGNSGNDTKSVILDKTAPTVTINQASGQADPSGAKNFNFTVNFSESVTGFTASGVSLSGTAGATSVVVTGSGTTYTVAVGGMISPGTVIATVTAGAAQDAAGNNSVASTSSDNSITFAPVLTITAPTEGATGVSTTGTFAGSGAAANATVTYEFCQATTFTSSCEASPSNTVTAAANASGVFSVTLTNANKLTNNKDYSLRVSASNGASVVRHFHT